MKDEHPPVHQLEHAEPTVIHHPEEDMTALARWLRRGMEQGASFWLLVGGVVATVALGVVILSGLSAGKTAGSEAWVEITQAKTAEERLKVADAHPNTPVAYWAKLLSAEEEYAYGVDDLTAPGKKELAGPRLKKALDLFQQVAKEAPPESSQALGGMFGAARTLEARNELPEAIEQYKLVTAKFPNSPEGKRSVELAKALDEPLNQMFYKELYAYKPPVGPASGLPGTGSLLDKIPGFGKNPASKSFLPDMTPPAGLDAPPPSTPAPVIEPPKVEAPKAEEPKVEAPKVEVPKAEPPKAEPPKAEQPKR